MSVNGVSASTAATAGNPSKMSGSDGAFSAAMLEALLQGTPKPIRSAGPDGVAEVVYRPSDAASLSAPNRNWIGAVKKSEIDIDQAVDGLRGVAGPDGQLSLADVQAYLQKYDPNGISASNLAVGWHMLTNGTGAPPSLDQVKSAVRDVVGSGASRVPTNDDPDALKNALAAFKKEAAKTVAERAKDQILKKHDLTEAGYEALPPDQKVRIDHEITDRVQLLMRTDGKKHTEPGDDEQVDAGAASAVADAFEKQQAAAQTVSARAAGFLLRRRPLASP